MDLPYNPGFCSRHTNLSIPEECKFCAQQRMTGTSDLVTSAYPPPPTMNSINGPFGRPFQNSVSTMSSTNRPFGYSKQPSMSYTNSHFGNPYQTQVSDTSALARALIADPPGIGCGPPHLQKPFQSYKTTQTMTSTSGTGRLLHTPARALPTTNSFESHFRQKSMRYVAPPVNMPYLNTLNPSHIVSSKGSKNIPALNIGHLEDGDYPERFALSPLESRPHSISSRSVDIPEPNKGEQHAQYERDGSPLAPTADVEMNTACKEPGKNQLLHRKQAATSKRTQKERLSNSNSGVSQARLVAIDEVTGETFYDNDTIVVDAADVQQEESESVGSGFEETDEEFDEELNEAFDIDFDEEIFERELDGELHWLVKDTREHQRALELEERKEPEDLDSSPDTSDERDLDYDDADAVCQLCQGDHCPTGNDIVLCDQCNMAVHQKCYGIEEIPSGNWYCRDCRPLKKTRKQKASQSPSCSPPNKTQSLKRKHRSENGDECSSSSEEKLSSSSSAKKRK